MKKAVQKKKTEQGDAYVADPNDVVDIQTLYDCQKKEEYGGIPDSSADGFDSTQCAGLVQMNKDDSYEKKKVTQFKTVEKSADGTNPIEVQAKTCYTAKNQDTGNAFITANFE